MHCEANFPGKKQQSDLDIPLPVGLDDDGYLQILAKQLPDLLSEVKPDLILYDAGVDTHVGDRGIYRREMLVLSTALAAGYPVASVIGGGYAENMQVSVPSFSLTSRCQRSILPVPPWLRVKYTPSMLKPGVFPIAKTTVLKLDAVYLTINNCKDKSTQFLKVRGIKRNCLFSVAMNIF
jgi:hypothetical protein